MGSQHKLRVLLTGAEIEAGVKKLAYEIGRDYRDKNPLLIGVLKGSFMFLADLIRRLEFQLEIDFVRVSSYGSGTESSGKIDMTQLPCRPVQGRHVLVVEDIVDTGLTTSFILDYLNRENPASLRLCSLLDKPARRRVPVVIDYPGFTVPDRFLVGYGLDWDEKYRNLAGIYLVEES